MSTIKSKITINGNTFLLKDEHAISYFEEMDIPSGSQSIAKKNIGLENADNTSDANKPVSTAQAAALALKVDKANVYNALDKTVSGYALDARQGKVLKNEKLDKSDIAIIVNGDTASMAVPVGGYAYIKNNTHGLSDGLYTNTSSSVFPTSGGTANSSVFTKVTNGGLNAIQQATAFKKLWSGSVGQNTVITMSESITHFKAVLVVAKSNVGTAETRIIPVDAINYISSQQTTSDDAWVVGVMYQSSAYAMTLIGFLSDMQIYVMDRNVISGWSNFYITAVYGMN